MELFQGKLTKTTDLFIPFIMAGDPTPNLTVDIALSLQEAGADILELGVPYSDPLADGPTIQEAAKRALNAGMSLKKAIELVPEMRQRGLKIPVVIFTYYNPVLRIGEAQVVQWLKGNQVEGLLIPDMPFEESESIRHLTEEANIEFISLVAPNSHTRVRQIAENARGFLYGVSSLGVTGERAELPNDVVTFIEQLKAFSKVPVAIGFGVSNSEQVELINSHADGVIIGSKIIRILETYMSKLQDDSKRIGALKDFTEEVKALIGKA